MKTENETEINQKLAKQRETEATEDLRLVSMVLDGQVNAFRHLVEKYQSPVYNLIVKIIHDKDEAKEITQEVFVKAYESLASFRSDHKFFSWIYRIAVNAALNQLKKQKKMVGLDTLKGVSDAAEELMNEREQLLQKAIKMLNEKYSVLIVLKYYEQMSYKEVAETMAITEKKVRSRLFEARQQLKEMLEKTSYF
ncbi:MAG TPA: sigma-70 family RNA polymerase sigma factor [Bacteroidales bacterium]|nr:sigma-70 family RNA polymerase sigma factor [Bacteroidales bacterium]HQQ12310.1 sigma-70 family RNA polymerase sigma factor [Bacteroidales bacterium]